MILSPTELQDKSLAELRSITTDFHASWHHNEKRETLIDRICELSAIVQPQEKDLRKLADAQAQKNGTPVKAAVVALSKEDIIVALEPQTEAGMLLRFSPDGKAWSMRFRDKVDTGSMTMPLRTIQRCADTIIRGRISVPKCQSCGELTEYREDVGYVCVNTACKKQAKPANPGKAA